MFLDALQWILPSLFNVKHCRTLHRHHRCLIICEEFLDGKVELFVQETRDQLAQAVLKLFKSFFSHSGQTILDISTAWAILPPLGELQIQFKSSAESEILIRHNS